ncbi:hypothetical protein EPUS_05830 [Endocarpon pusillum Z07020]|uniref:Nephrocystin 3-like N-terminal domain-containing protein n=1 Tax=Endocarpon pusillum (strain Z07020 / HMAS-L-300199) TaxID=1263415 RepID=U1GFX8_ENDPU|nr:uncharacterized protein EPUS_05830 [Endocarpon pusillum Z07020]ERF76557.1 hypothetical protein EPUS_05830 [Endocarpon pusillum Z07020]
MSVQRIGLSIVYQPTNGACHDFDIVLVHGLFGHPKNTWSTNIPWDLRETNRNDGNIINNIDEAIEDPPRKKARTLPKKLFREVFWPRDLLPKSFPQARILTWGYDVQIDQLLSSTSKASIFHHSETLLSDLAMVRSAPLEKEVPIIFIAHSLGGIVVKDALSLSRNETTFFNEILPATVGVLFLGTPHHGSKTASLGKIAFELSKLAFKTPNVQVLRGLEPKSEILERISRSFGQILATGNVKVHSFREELDTKGMMIVDSSSATIGYLHETRGSLHANHRDMAKFSCLEDVKFQRVVAVLGRWVEDIVGAQPPCKLRVHLDGNAPEVPDHLVFDEQYQACLRSLNYSEARVRFQNVEPAYEKTYKWLFHDRLGLTDWLQGKTRSSMFWLRGKPGSGKSTAMKFIMTHPLTRELLEKYHLKSWIVAGYFFHDRGTSAQKTAVSFLREILYQILLDRRDLFGVVYPVFKQLEENQSLTGVSADAVISWSISQLEAALELIGVRSTVDVNLCLFVDALDEHDGKHRELLSTLTRLARLTSNPLFRMRLCVSGRPDNVFVDGLQGCPGFAIEDHTTDDIGLYAEGRLQTEMRGELTKEGKQKLKTLGEDLIQKAQGVFLWVRLVVDELIDGLCEGDSIEELQSLLSETPTELKELYTRAIRRVSRTSPSLLSTMRYEAYVMFQIATHCPRPFSLYHFLSAALFVTTNKGIYTDLQTLSESQMERRLYSRSAGLLEATGPPKRSVQYIHQTVKEFMRNGQGDLIIREGISDRSQHSVNILLFRYLISAIPSLLDVDIGEQRVVTGNLLYYAYKAELEEGICVARYLDPVIFELPEKQQDNILFGTIAHFVQDSLRELEAPIFRWFIFKSPRRGGLRPRIQLLIIYIVTNLPLSLQYSITSQDTAIEENDAYVLLKAALMRYYALKMYDESDSSQILEVLLKSGVASGVSDQSYKLLDEIVESIQADQSPEAKRQAQLWAQFRHNAPSSDKRCY